MEMPQGKGRRITLSQAMVGMAARAQLTAVSWQGSSLGHYTVVAASPQQNNTADPSRASRVLLLPPSRYSVGGASASSRSSVWRAMCQAPLRQRKHNLSADP